MLVLPHTLYLLTTQWSIVGVGTTTPGRVSVVTTSGIGVTISNFPNAVEVRTRSNQGRRL